MNEMSFELEKAKESVNLVVDHYNDDDDDDDDDDDNNNYDTINIDSNDLRFDFDLNSLIWQLIDSSFPSGGFSHSNGLESAASIGILSNLSSSSSSLSTSYSSFSIIDYVHLTIEQICSTSLPFVTNGWKIGKQMKNKQKYNKITNESNNGNELNKKKKKKHQRERGPKTEKGCFNSLLHPQSHSHSPSSPWSCSHSFHFRDLQPTYSNSHPYVPSSPSLSTPSSSPSPSPSPFPSPSPSRPFYLPFFSSFLSLDEFCSSTLTNSVSRQASTLLGNSFLAAVSQTFTGVQLKQSTPLHPSSSSSTSSLSSFPALSASSFSSLLICSLISSFKFACRSSCTPINYSCVYGVICSFLSISLIECQQMFLYNQMKSLISSIVRLNCIGPYEGQRLQLQCWNKVKEEREKWETKTIQDVSTSAPIVDVVQQMHANLYTRLFNS